MKRAGEKLLSLGAKAVLMKGGHLEGDRVVDLLVQDGRIDRFEDARIASRSTHGTGCTLASAIAAGLAQKMSLARCRRPCAHLRARRDRDRARLRPGPRSAQSRRDRAWIAGITTSCSTCAPRGAGRFRHGSGRDRAAPASSRGAPLAFPDCSQEVNSTADQRFPSMRMNAMRHIRPERFAQAWFVPRWIRMSPARITVSSSSMMATSSPMRTIA